MSKSEPYFFHQIPRLSFTPIKTSFAFLSIKLLEGFRNVTGRAFTQYVRLRHSTLSERLYVAVFRGDGGRSEMEIHGRISDGNF
jgi:hypothetical protein